MAEATVVSTPLFPMPNVEVVKLTVSDGETYKSRKFSRINHVIATGNEDVDAYLNVVPDGTNVVTINYAGQTDKAVTLVIFAHQA